MIEANDASPAARDVLAGPESPGPPRRDGGPQRLLLAVLFAGAALYCGLGAFATLEYTDEGVAIYPAWRFAHGAFPHRDVQHIYGPGVFFLNAGLFTLFGDDLTVIRWSLVLLRAALSLLVYLAARHVASRRAALLTWGLFVAIWGAPIWLFNTAYANHYGLVLGYLGLLCFSSRRASGGRLHLFAAGLFLGFAALFKQTQGVSYTVALGASLIAAPLLGGDQPERGESGGRIRCLLPPLLILFAVLLGASLGLATASTLLLLAPFVLGLAWIAQAELRNRYTIGSPARLFDLVCFGVATLLPIAACGALYWSAGALPALVRDTLVGMPQLVTWYTPLPTPSAHTLAIAGLAVSCFALVGAATSAETTKAAVALRAGATAVFAVAVAKTAASQWGWVGDVFAVESWFPIVCVIAFMGPALARSGRQPPPQSAMLTSVWLFAAASLPQLYPAADLPHVAMVFPAMLPLLARAVDAFCQSAAAAGSADRVRFACCTAAVLLMTAPLLQTQMTTVAQRPSHFEGLEHARGIWAGGERVESSAQLLALLRTEPRPMFVLANQSLLYFLSGRSSLFDRGHFMLYMVGADLIGTADARRMLPESTLLATLVAERPVVVDDVKDPAGARIRAAYPKVARFLSDNYRLAEHFGDYQVWRWAPSLRQSGL